MKNHLNLHFKRVTIKNPRLLENNYMLMHFLFLKAIITGMKNNLEIIYIDETGCFLQNDNYRDWVSKGQSIYEGATKGLKSKVNVICAINLKKVIHYKIVESSVNSEIFEEFIKDLCSKMTNEEKENSLFIYDNATCHKAKSIKKICKENKLKILTNIPYKSEFNGIEFFFGYFKNEYYKYVFNE